MQQDEPDEGHAVDGDDIRPHFVEEALLLLEMVQGCANKQKDDATDAQQQPVVRDICRVRVLDGPGGLVARITLVLVNHAEVGKDGARNDQVRIVERRHLVRDDVVDLGVELLLNLLQLHLHGDRVFLR